MDSGYSLPRTTQNSLVSNRLFSGLPGNPDASPQPVIVREKKLSNKLLSTVAMLHDKNDIPQRKEVSHEKNLVDEFTNKLHNLSNETDVFLLQCKFKIDRNKKIELVKRIDNQLKELRLATANKMANCSISEQEKSDLIEKHTNLRNTINPDFLRQIG